ncbi:hypothetical protein BU17DRAFT_90102 [Hysterangium stoloniferum]|nr:hypothetical protein BU17DRAFT_90102 [Hysterangium stoloniferum]
MGRESKYCSPPLDDQTTASCEKGATQIISLVDEKEDNEKKTCADVKVEMVKEHVPAKRKTESRTQPIANSSRSRALLPSRRKNKTSRHRTETGTDSEAEIPEGVIVVERRVSSRVPKATRHLLKGTPIGSTPSNSPWPDTEPPAGPSSMTSKAASSSNTPTPNYVQTLDAPRLPLLPLPSPPSPKCNVCSSCGKNTDPAKESTCTECLEPMNHSHGSASAVEAILDFPASQSTSTERDETEARLYIYYGCLKHLY